jgi:hypothetical protein
MARSGQSTGVALGQRGFHARNILEQGFAVLDGDGTFTHRAQVFGGCAFGNQLVAIIGQLIDILRGGPRGIAFKSRQPVTDVGGVADLAGLAIAHDVDTGLLLQADNVFDAALHGGIETLGL